MRNERPLHRDKSGGPRDICPPRRMREEVISLIRSASSRSPFISREFREPSRRLRESLSFLRFLFLFLPSKRSVMRKILRLERQLPRKADESLFRKRLSSALPRMCPHLARMKRDADRQKEARGSNGERASGSRVPRIPFAVGREADERRASGRCCFVSYHRRSGVASARGQSRSVDAAPPDTL